MLTVDHAVIIDFGTEGNQNILSPHEANDLVTPRFRRSIPARLIGAFTVLIECPQEAKLCA